MKKFLVILCAALLLFLIGCSAQRPTVDENIEVIESSEPEKTSEPTLEPTPVPTVKPTTAPTVAPTIAPTIEPTPTPTPVPTPVPYDPILNKFPKVLEIAKPFLTLKEV